MNMKTTLLAVAELALVCAFACTTVSVSTRDNTLNNLIRSRPNKSQRYVDLDREENRNLLHQKPKEQQQDG